MTDKPQRDYSHTKLPRVSKLKVPNTPTACDISTQCPFLVDGKCSSPRDNRKNNQAACKKLTPKELIERIGKN